MQTTKQTLAFEYKPIYILNCKKLKACADVKHYDLSMESYWIYIKKVDETNQ